MAKRGRPDVFQQRNMEGIGDMIRTCYPDLTPRQQTNIFYQTAGRTTIREDASDIPGYEILIKKDGVLEQLDRMWEQDGFTKENVICVAKEAGQLLLEGGKARDVEQMIRSFRIERKNDLNVADSSDADDQTIDQ